MSLALGGCGSAGNGGDAEPRDGVRVTSFSFTESMVLAELYALALERAGIPVIRRIGLAAREVVEPALEQGVVDLVPEYTGTALTFLDRKTGRATSDQDRTYALLRDAFAQRGVTTLAKAPARDENAIAVTAATAKRLDLVKVSDLRPVASKLVFGGPPECPERPLCLGGLESEYGLHFKSFTALDAGGPLTVSALSGHEIDVALLFTTTPQVETSGFVLLDDDRGMQPADNVVPVVRTEVLHRYGERLSDALDRVSAQLTSDELRALNAAVDVRGTTPQVAAATWFRLHFGR